MTGPRSRAAQQQLARRRLVERLGLVVDVAVDEARLAAVAHAGAAGPVGGHVARLGELEQAAVAVVPRDRQCRAAERDLGARAGRARRRVRVGSVVARLGAEHLAVQPLGRDAPAEQARRSSRAGSADGPQR